MSWREVSLLLAPILLLVYLGVWLPNRRPFKLIVTKVNATRLPKGPFGNSEPNTKGVEVIVFLDHEGPTPSWWGKQFNAGAGRVHFTAPGEKDDKYTNVGMYQGVSFDENRNQYIFGYKGEIPKEPSFLKNSTCHISVAFDSQTPPFGRVACVKASVHKSDLLTVMEQQKK